MQTDFLLNHTDSLASPLHNPTAPLRVAIIGGGPAGLMAAEVLASAGPAVSVQLFDAMPSVGRKFLLAGKGGLNLTHSEPPEVFMRRYGEHGAALQPLIAAFGPAELRAWAEALGIETFVGSSGLVFPKDMKAAPLLRAWLHRLRQLGRAVFHAPPLAGLGRGRRADVFNARGRGAGSGRRRGAGAGRRQLGAPGLGRRLGAAAGRARRARGAAAALELRF